MTGNRKNGNGSKAPKIAIVGMAAMFPGESGTTGFWRTIARGQDAIGDIPPHYWHAEDYYDADPAAPDKTYCNRGGFIDKVAFDTLKFGVPPSVMKATDTAQLLALMAASEVLDGVEKTQSVALDKSRTAVVLGVASATELAVHMGSRLQRPIWANALREHGMAEEDVNAICDRISDHFVPWQEASFPGLLGNVVAGRIANRLDLGGANFVTDAACASSLSALQAGLQQLYLRDADLVIVGGVDALNDILMFMCFSKTPAFSKSGDCRPFSDQADGTILGEGVAMFALRRLEDAECDGNEIYAVITGLGAASDGRATSVYAPRPEGQALAIRRAYEAAGYDPTTVELVEAHGTGTKAGDAAEFGGLRLAFDTEAARRQSVALGSVKSQIGHTKAAAGSAGLFKAAMALHHGVVPPTIKVDRPNPNLKLEESPFFINTELRPWIRGNAHPRRAAVSSFGFGGSNFHVALEEYRGPGKRARKRRHHDCELVLASAATPAELDRALAAIADRAAAADLSRVAFESHARFDAVHSCRASLVATSTADLTDEVAKAREQIASNLASAPITGRARVDLAPADAGRIAFIFPGQGSQYVGMGGGIATAFEHARQVWDRAADLVAVGNSTLHDAVFPPPAFTKEARAEQEARLTRMAFAQPAIAATEASMLALLGALGVRAHCFAGHSFGEVMALHAAGAYGLDSALQIAAERGRLMTEAARCTEGAMLAVAASHNVVADLVAELHLDVVLANDNSPQQVVLSGLKPAIAAAEAALRQRGLNVTALPVATGFHSPIVADSVAPFRSFLATEGLVAPGRTVYANATASPYPSDARSTEETLAGQLGQAVRFRETIERMHADGVRVFVEVGPGSVLTSLVRQCLGDRSHRAIALDRKGAKGLGAFWQGIGELALAGVTVDLRPLWDEAPAEPELKRASGAHVFEIDGVNVGKPYPARKTAGASAALPLKPAVAAAAVRSPAPTVSAHDGKALFQSFQALLEEQRKHLETTLMDAHRAHVESSSVAFLAMIGADLGSPAVVAPAASAPAPVTPAPAPVILEMRAPEPIVAPAAPPVAAKAAEKPTAAPGTDVLRLVEAIVSEKTGYPPEVLGHDMDLEAELGIDSIKQVEILSALRDRMPGLPEIEPSALARFRTIAAIAGMIGGHAPTPAASAMKPAPAPALIEAPPPAPDVLPVEPVVAAGGNDALLRLVEAIVSEKTGYPPEVLGHDMDLEAELGIDSIKQVEILSALRDRMPGLPEIEPSALARFRTIAAIAGMIGGHAPTPAASAMKPAPAPALIEAPPPAPDVLPVEPVVAAGGNDALLRLVEAIVSEKTGYPPEVLGHDMDLEAELGIDSIKQVEILSALRDRMPGLPEIEPAALARFRTIAAIAGMIGGHAPTPAASALKPAPAPALIEAPPPAPDVLPVEPVVAAGGNDALLRLVEAIVSEKTGYPPEVLGHDMDLEAELGIDSIKQVEILSALRDRMPGLPEIEPAALARFRTIAAIAGMIAAGGSPADVPPTPPGASAPVPSAAQAPTNPLSREVYELVARPASGLILPNVARATSVTLAGGPAALTDALGRRLRERGVEVVATSGDIVVFLGGLDGGASAAASLDLHRAAFEAAKVAAGAFGGKGLAFIAVQDCGGDFGYGGGSLERPWFGGLSGLIKSASREWPTADVKAIDIATAGRDAEAIAELIVTELYAGGPEIEVAYDAAGLRSIPVRRACPLDVLAGIPLDDGDVVIVTGGARGVTAAAATALAKEKRLRLCLLGRSRVLDEAADLAGADDDVALRQRLVARATAQGQYPDLLAIRREAAQVLASREIVATLAAIRAAGSEARYVRCDVNDAASVNAAIAEICRELGPVAGVIHGAGVIADKAIADKSVADFEAVYRTKVGAFATLLDAVDRDALKVLCNFSSVSAKFGNSGQADYAMANETLNKLAIAYARANPACRVKSICWGPWEGGMVDASLKRHFEKVGVGMITLDAGARALVEELASDDGAVEVVLREGDFLPEGKARMTVDLDPAAYPFLADHRITGDAVLPVVMVQEWFARGVRSQVPDAGSLSIEGLSVLRGVVLSGFPARRYRFDIEIEAVPGDRRAFALMLRDTDGQPRYAARAVAHGAGGPAFVLPAAATDRGPLAPAPVYAGHRLFHGPAFQTLHRVGSMTDEGGTAEIGSTHDRAWPGSSWESDPAAIDGCLQLAILWGREKSGVMSLPGRIGSCRVFRLARPGETYTCRMRSCTVDAFRTEHDVDLMLDGEVAIMLRGIEMYRAKAGIAA